MILEKNLKDPSQKSTMQDRQTPETGTPLKGPSAYVKRKIRQIDYILE
jgi:hypothetical protein